MISTLLISVIVHITGKNHIIIFSDIFNDKMTFFTPSYVIIPVALPPHDAGCAEANFLWGGTKK